MFLQLTQALHNTGYGRAAIFDLHPGQILTFVDALFEREHERTGFPYSGRRLDPTALTYYGASETATGKELDAGAFIDLASAAVARREALPTLAWAWLVEGSGLVAALSAFVVAELQGDARRLKSPGSRRWLRTTEELMTGENLLTLRSVVRPSPAETRATLYRRRFGAPVGARGIVHDGFEGSFTTLMGRYLEGDATAQKDLQTSAGLPTELTRESFAAVGLVSWFHLSLSLPDSPIAADLGVADQDLAGRLAAVHSLLQVDAREKAPALLAVADRVEQLLSKGLDGDADRVELAKLWADLAGEPDEDAETGAGGDVALAFGGRIRFRPSDSFSFTAEGLQPSTLQVTDADARVRSGPPSFSAGTTRIPQGSQVVATEVYLSGDTYYVCVAPAGGGDAEWTKLSNLAVPANALVGLIPATDQSQTGPFAMWEKGAFTGLTPLWLVGGNGKLVLAAEKALTAHMDMCAAAEDDDIALLINSAFRSYPEQKACYDVYKAKGSPLAAKPGYSAHQSGMAIDLSMGMGTSTLTTDVSKWSKPFRWMVRNAWRYGFVRTVKSECWHWEYRPEKAVEDDANGDLKALIAAGG